MANLLSILIGVVVLLAGLIAFIPFLGWLNWIVVPLGVIGAAIGALSRSRSGMTMNLILVVVFGIRWWLGGFIF